MGLWLGGVREGDVFMCVFFANGNDLGKRERGIKATEKERPLQGVKLLGRSEESSYRREELAFGKMRTI